MSENLTNILNICLAVAVMVVSYQGMSKAGKAAKPVLLAIMLSGLVLGGAELIDLLQIFPDGTMLADLVYEKEIPVLLLLLWGGMSAAKLKK